MPKVRGASRPRFRLLPTVLLAAAILALPTVVYAWGRSSSSFTIKHVGVTGTKLVPEKRVLRLLRRDYRGVNLFAVTAKDVRETLAPLCFVAGAAVDRDFPDTLRVDIVEYDPAVYALAKGKWYVISEEGHVVCEVQGGPSKRTGAEAAPSPEASSEATPDATTTDPGTGAAAQTDEDQGQGEAAGSKLDKLLAGPPDMPLRLPRVAVTGRLEAGDDVRDGSLTDILHVISALPRSLSRRLAVAQTDDGRITLRFADGPVASWGDAGRTVAKTIALRLVLAEYREAGRECTEIDVSIPGHVVARPVLE